VIAILNDRFWAGVAVGAFCAGLLPHLVLDLLGW
jgi:hypothetical protein